MIRKPDIVQELDDNLARQEGRLPFHIALQYFAALWEEGIHLGVLPPKDPWEGVEVDIRIAAVLNACLKNSSPE